jgi:hypothetical protein
MANCRPNSRRDFFFPSRPLRVYWLLLLLWYKRRDRDSKRCNNILLSWSRLSRPANRKRKNLFPSPFFTLPRKRRRKFLFFFYVLCLFTFFFLPSFCRAVGVVACLTRQAFSAWLATTTKSAIFLSHPHTLTRSSQHLLPAHPTTKKNIKK